MSNRNYICRNLRLSVWLDGQHAVVHLEDPFDTTEAQVSNEMGMSTRESREYHLREAMTIAVRQLLTQGWELGMFKVDVSKLPMPPIKPERQRPQQSFIDDFMRDDDII